MAKQSSIPKQGKAKHRKRPSRVLDGLIEDATVDAYNESEQVCGFYTMMEDHLVLPFRTQLLGVEVIVEKVDLTVSNEIVAACRRGRTRQRIPILDLPLPKPEPSGSEWIAAYRRWQRNS